MADRPEQPRPHRLGSLAQRVTRAASRRSPDREGRAGRDLLEQQEAMLVAALGAAESELDRAMREAWLACVRADVAIESLRERCDLMQRRAEHLERELRHVRASLSGPPGSNGRSAVA
jgi:hypothetical protein